MRNLDSSTKTFKGLAQTQPAQRGGNLVKSSRSVYAAGIDRLPCIVGTIQHQHDIVKQHGGNGADVTSMILLNLPGKVSASKLNLLRTNRNNLGRQNLQSEFTPHPELEMSVRSNLFCGHGGPTLGFQTRTVP